MDDLAKELCYVAEDQGWKKELFLKIDEAYLCSICKNVCRDCVELSCEVEHTDEEFEVYCIDCIKRTFTANGNKCPINGHDNASYAVSRSSRSRILRSQVRCPISQYFLDNSETTKGDSDEEDQEEGEGPGADGDDAILGCDFEGTLTELMLRHINQCCITQAATNPALQSKMLARMKKTTKNLVERVSAAERMDVSSAVEAMISRFHTENNHVFAARGNEVQQLQREFAEEKSSQASMEAQIEANKQEIQQLKDSLSAMKRSFNDYKDQASANLQSAGAAAAAAASSSSSAGSATAFSGRSGKPFDSILIENASDQHLLVSWIPGGDSKSFSLKYRATRDGWPASNFHSKCDACPQSVVVVQGENNNLFGGYTSKTWDQAFRNWKTDDQAFIFLLRSADNSHSAAKYAVSSSATAVYAHSSYGPNFGNGPDLEVKSDQNIVSDLENGSCSYSAPKNNKIFSGVSSRSFRIKDYEVFEIK